MKSKKILLLTLLLSNYSFGQNVGINSTGAAPAASAMLDVSSTTSGFLVPRMTTAQRTAIVAPATGLLVYDTTIGSFYYFDGTQWIWLLGNTTGWTLNGNTPTAANFMGSTNAVAVRFYCNNIERFRLNPTDGEFVAGATASPYAGDLMAGVSTAALTFAVNGYTAQNGSGVWGETMAASTTAFSSVQGVYGGTGGGSGVLGNYNGTNTSNTRSGVFGVCSTPAASVGGTGVYGYSSMASGSMHMGVLGNYNGTSFGIGVHGIAFGGGILTGNNDAAVVGWRANNANYSGYFNGNHVIANGTKSASVGTSQGNQLLYCMESPEVWFEDFGTANLVNGRAEIQLDKMYLETVLIDEEHPMHVFVQVQGDCNDVFVVPGTTSFVVQEKDGGNSNVKFSYRLVAKRYSFPDHRFGNDPVWGEGDTRKYMEVSPARPIDYKEGVKMDEENKRNWKPTPSPAVTYPDVPQQKTVKDKK